MGDLQERYSPRPTQQPAVAFDATPRLRGSSVELRPNVATARAAERARAWREDRRRHDETARNSPEVLPMVAAREDVFMPGIIEENLNVIQTAVGHLAAEGLTHAICRPVWPLKQAPNGKGLVLVLMSSQLRAVRGVGSSGCACDHRVRAAYATGRSGAELSGASGVGPRRPELRGSFEAYALRASTEAVAEDERSGDCAAVGGEV